MKSLRIAFVDATEPGLLGFSWRLGAFLLSPFFDDVHLVRSVDEVVDILSTLPRGQVESVQFWGHGSPGRFYVNRKALNLDHPALDNLRGSEVWFRACDVMNGTPGHTLAQKLSNRGISSAGHLAVVGPWACQSYLVGCRAGQSPWWSKDFDGETSAPWAPRTVSALRLSASLPPWTWSPGRGVTRSLLERKTPT